MQYPDHSTPPPTDAELAEWGARHEHDPRFTEKPLCGRCRLDWPCPTFRLIHEAEDNRRLRAHHSTGPLWEVAYAIAGGSGSADIIELMDAYGAVDTAYAMTLYPRQLHRIRALLRAALEAEDPPISPHAPPGQRSS